MKYMTAKEGEAGLKQRFFKIALVLMVTIFVAVAATLIVNHFTNRQSETGVRVTIQIQGDGFNPGAMTIRSGTTVTWTNTDNQPHRITSTPFPEHTDLPGLDSQQNIGPGNSYSYTFTKTGSFGFIDYLHPSYSGTIVVK